jgi:hypothetical protein
MPNFRPSCGTKRNNATARFCSNCGHALANEKTPPAAVPDWQVVVGDIPPPVPPGTAGSTRSRTSVGPRTGQPADKPKREQPVAENASLVTPVITPFAATAWGALPLVGSLSPEKQTQGGGMLLMASVALIGGLVAKRSQERPPRLP